jgi:hypothetical protein
MFVKKFILFSVSAFYFFTALGQIKSNPKQSIGLNIGRSINSTGDMRGVTYSTVYSKKFRNRLSWIATFGGTLRDCSSDLFFTDPNLGGK